MPSYIVHASQARIDAMVSFGKVFFKLDGYTNSFVTQQFHYLPQHWKMFLSITWSFIAGNMQNFSKPGDALCAFGQANTLFPHDFGIHGKLAPVMCETTPTYVCPAFLSIFFLHRTM